MIISVLLVHWLVWAINVQTWTWFHWMSIVISVGIFTVFTICVSVINLTTSSSRDGVSFGIYRSFASLEFWLGSFVTCSLCVIPYSEIINNQILFF